MTTYQLDEGERRYRIWLSCCAFGQWLGQKLLTGAIDQPAMEISVFRFVQCHHFVSPLDFKERLALVQCAVEAAEHHVETRCPAPLSTASYLGLAECNSAL